MSAALDKTNIFAPEFGADPFEFYQKALLSDPVLYLPDLDTWLVTGSEYVNDICRQPEIYSSDISILLAGTHADSPKVKSILDKGWPQLQVLLMSDPPSHSRYRRLVGLAFSAPRVNAIEDTIREISLNLLKKQPLGSPWDFIRDYAVPLPVTMIANQLGFTSSEAEKVRKWTEAFTDRLGGMIDEERSVECAEIVVDFQHAMKTKIEERRSRSYDDLLGDLVSAASEGDEPLSDAEILSVIQQLTVAGNETSTNTMAEGIKLFIENPDQWKLLREQPELIKNATEEILRLASPVAGIWRIVTQNTVLNGHVVPAGAKVMLRFAAASRDPEIFENPDKFDIERPNAKSHFAFGRGIHTCLGNMLARKEIMVALEQLSQSFETLELAVPKSELTYSPNIMLRGLRSLPIIAK